jgi:hypothetical protein
MRGCFSKVFYEFGIHHFRYDLIILQRIVRFQICNDSFTAEE